MPYVVTLNCLENKCRDCVEVCPVDCFYDICDPSYNKKYKKKWANNDTAEADLRNAGMLMINPDECIDCGACLPECPVDAIYEDSAVPANMKEFVQLNADVTLSMSDDELDQTRCTSKV